MKLACVLHVYEAACVLALSRLLGQLPVHLCELLGHKHPEVVALAAGCVEQVRACIGHAAADTRVGRQVIEFDRAHGTEPMWKQACDPPVFHEIVCHVG